MTVAGVLAAVLLLTMAPSVIDGKYVEGVVDTSKDMEFLERFVFEPDELGQLWYEFKYPADYCCYQLLLFNDDESQWPYVRANEEKLTCSEKKAQIPSNYNAVVTLSTPYNCVNKTEFGQEYLVCSGTRHFVADRPRWWFINVANCNQMSPTEGIHLQYKLNMTNGERPLDKHFSADERYTLQTSIAFTVLYFCMTLIGTYYKYKLSKKKMLHSTYQLFFTSVCLQLAALIIITIALGNFAGDGIKMPALKTIGHVISSFGDVVFVLMLMLVGKGYTITRGRISTTGSVKLAVFISLYTLTFVFLYTYEQMAFDPRDIMFIYDSPAALGLIVLRVIGIIWLYYCVFFTVKNFVQKLKFYVPFMIFFAVWFAAEPIMIGVANEFIPKYNRAKIVYGVYWSMIFLGHMFFLVLTRPDRTNEYFPYHIKTNQIAAMIIGDGVPSDFVNPYIGEPLTRSLTNIFVGHASPKATVPPPYSSRPPRGPKVNNFVSASLHAVSSESVHDDNGGPAQQPKAPATGPNFSIFCVEKSQPAIMALAAHKEQSAPVQDKVRKGKKISRSGAAHRSPASVVPADTLAADLSIKDYDDEVQQQVSSDSDFVEIPLNDLTITDIA